MEKQDGKIENIIRKQFVLMDFLGKLQSLKHNFHHADWRTSYETPIKNFSQFGEGITTCMILLFAWWKVVMA